MNTNNMELNIKEIKRRFELLKKVDDKDWCIASDLAKELKVRKTDLAAFIEDNPSLFSLGSLKGKKTGMVIMHVYETIADNPITDEWLARKIKEYERCIHVSEIEYYRKIQAQYLEIDTVSNSQNREHIWRNTPEKIKEIQKLGILKEEDVYYGSIGDSYKRHIPFNLIGDWMTVLKNNGWKFETGEVI